MDDTDPTMLRFLRPRKADAYRAVEAGLADRSGRLGVQVRRDVLLRPLGQMIGVTAAPPEGAVIDDCEYVSVLEPARSAPARTGRTVYGGYMQRCWGHFLLGTTARLWWALRSANAGEWDRIVFVCEPGEPTALDANYRLLLELLGIADRVDIVDRPTAFSRLIIPDMAYEHDVYYSSEMMETIGAIVRGAMSRGDSGADSPGEPRPIFLTRSRLPRARTYEVNSRELDRMMAANGYEVVAPEHMPLDRLIRLMRRAPEVVSVSGSLAHNLVFARPDSLLVIFDRGAINNVFQISISLMARQRPLMVDAFQLPLVAPHSGRVFMYWPTAEFLGWAASRGLDPDEFAAVARRPRRSLARFMSGYRREYGRLVGFEYETVSQAAAVAEAYGAARDEFYDWLRGFRAIYLTDALRPLYWARRIKRLLSPRR